MADHAVSPAVVRALAAHPTVGYVQVASDGAPSDWTPLAEIVADVEPWLARVAPRTQGDRAATAAFFLGWTARAAVALPIALLTTDRRALAATADAVRLRVADGGWATGIAFATAGVATLADDEIASVGGADVVADEMELAQRTGGTITAVVGPLVESLRATSKMGRGIWNLIVDALAASVVARCDEEARAAALIDAVCGRLPVAARIRPELAQVVGEDGATALRATRTGCCLALRIPGTKLCEDCPVLVARQAAGAA